MIISFGQVPLPSSFLLPFNIGLILGDILEHIDVLLLLLQVSLHGLLSFEGLFDAFATLTTFESTHHVALHEVKVLLDL